jgi:hypothetical protein
MNQDLLYLVLALFSGYMYTQDTLNQLNQQYCTPYFYEPCTFKAEGAPSTVSFKYRLCTIEAHNSDQTPTYSPQIALAWTLRLYRFAMHGANSNLQTQLSIISNIMYHAGIRVSQSKPRIIRIFYNKLIKIETYY